MKSILNLKNRYLRILTVCFLFLFALGNQALRAQITITSPESPTCLMTVEVGVAITPVVLQSDEPGIDWTVEGINIVPSLDSLGLSLDPATGTISGTPLLTGEYDVDISVAEAANPANFDLATIRICITRQPVDIMLALDRSGSMGQIVPGGSMTKWDVMQEAVETFLIELAAFGVSGDQVGVVFFDESREDFDVPGSPGLHPFVNETAIMTDFVNFPASGYTCIGGSILAAHGALAANPFSHIILMSDGIQNRDPSYDEISKIVQDHGTFTDGTGWPGGSLNLITPPNQFKIHTIAIGDNAVTSLMQGISTANSNTDLHGEHLLINTTAGLVTTLDNFFDEDFVATLANFSPAIVNKRVMTLPPEFGGNTFFNVNNSADKVVIKAVGDPRDMKGLRMNIRKGSVTFPNDIRYDRSRIIFTADKDMLAERGVQPGGRWDVQFTGRGNITINVSCLVNDELINYETSMGGVSTEPGDPLNLNLSVDILGNPVTNLNQARALVLKPSQDLNDLFSAANSSIDPPGEWQSEPGVNPGQDKYEKLLAFDESFISALIPQENIINLTNNGDGTYSATFNDTEESGVYSVYFYFSGNTPEQGDFERFRLQTRSIDFGVATEENTNFSVVTGDDISKFILTPKNKFGHLIGPNRLNQISILVDGNKVELVDKLDGTYEATVPSFGFFNTNPDVQVGIKGGDFYEGKYADIDGVNLSLYDLYRPWIILLALLIIIIIYLIRRKKP